MPAWLRFLETRRLIDAELRERTLALLTPLNSDLIRFWKTFEDDPLPYQRAQAWPDDARKGPRTTPGESEAAESTSVCQSSQVED